jgi:hypothetical protein
MSAKGVVVPLDRGPVWNMALGRLATLKLQSGETAESMIMFEEVAPPGTQTNFHLHRYSDEVAYVLSGEVTRQDRRSGHGRRTRYMRLLAAGCRTRLEDHRKRPARILFI